MIIYILGFALISSVIVALVELFTKGRPISVGIASFIVNALINWAVIYGLMPDFSYFPGGGYAFIFFLNLAIGLAISVLASYLDNKGSEWHPERNFNPGGVIAAIWIVLFLIWGSYMYFQPGWVCDNRGLDRLAALFEVKDTESSMTDTNLSDLVGIAPDTAFLKASSAMGGSATLGSYLSPNATPLQHVANQLITPVDFKVDNWRSYRSAGQEVPGYIWVSSSNPDTPAKLVTGYALKYVPEARWSLDLTRHVYLNYALPERKRLEDLHKLELDDDGRPWYTATVMEYVEGWRGYVPAAVITVDPETGDITEYSIDEAPEWIDRIWSIPWVNRYANYWAIYTHWDACQFRGQTGQKQIDETNDVITATDQAFQITFTSVGADLSATELVHFDPRTGEAIRYDYSGPTLEFIDSQVEEASFRILEGKGYLAQECEIHHILNETTAYCILVGKDEEEGGGRQHGGYAFLPTRLAAKTDAVALGNDLHEAYNQLLDKIAGSGGSDTDLAESMSTEQFQGTIDRKAIVGDYVYIMLQQVPDKVFRLQADRVASLSEVGDSKVVITANQIPYEGVYIVINFYNPQLPEEFNQ